MLTADLAMSWQRGKRTGPRSIDADDANHLRTAEDLIFIVGQHVDRQRAELDQALDEFVGSGTDYRVLRGLIKLLQDRCEFETLAVRDPSEIRAAVFARAAAHHPIDQTTHAQVIAEVAAEFECAPAEITAGLYADLSGRQRLVRFDEPGVSELLDHYNVAQAQALLYRCTEMRLTLDPQSPAAARRLFAEIRRFGLIHTISGNPQRGYEVVLNGPVSLFHRSQKYGIQMAVFLPALLLLQGWQMRAEITTKNATAFFELDSDEHKLRSHYLVEDIPDSNPLVDKLVDAFATAEGDWQAARSSEVIGLGESAFAPDLAFAHRDGRRMWMEIVGYWTPRYINDRLREFEKGAFTSYLLAVSEEMLCSRDAPANFPPNVIVFKTALPAKQVLRVLDDVAGPTGDIAQPAPEPAAKPRRRRKKTSETD